MDNLKRTNEMQKQAALRRLGTDSPVCVTCGEDDYRCLERHHVAGSAYDDSTVIMCRNCHRKVSHPWENSKAPVDPPLMQRVGNMLIGLGEFLLQLAKRLRELGEQLLQGVRVCPWPWGSQEVTQ